ncbi:MAG TPA: hypothetical protein V6D11_21575 [Waterburya sp.]|jgi:hypothetical protein
MKTSARWVSWKINAQRRSQLQKFYEQLQAEIGEGEEDGLSEGEVQARSEEE